MEECMYELAGGFKGELISELLIDGIDGGIDR